VAGDQEKEDAGRKLREANQSKIERPMRERIDLPAHRDGLHLSRASDEDSRRHEQTEIGISKRDERGH